jgi:glycosyltransferase 2 family protein
MRVPFRSGVGEPFPVRRATHMLFAIFRTAIAIGLLVYLGVSGVISWSALHGLATSWGLTLAALVVLAVDVCVIAWRLCVLFKPRALYLSLFSSLRLTLMGIFFNVCLPGSTGGDVIKIYYATRDNHGRRTEVATIMLLDRAIGMFALMIWPLLVAPLFPQLLRSLPILRFLLWAAAAVSCVMFVGMLVGSMERVRHSRFVAWTFRKLPLGSYAERVFDTIHAYRHNLTTLLAAVGLSLLAHTMTIGGTLLAAQAMNPSGFVWQMSLLIPLGFLANSLPLTPGGLGVGEAAFDRLFSMAGLTGGAEALLGWRILMVIMGLPGLFFYLQGRKRLIHDASSVPSVLQGLSSPQ